MENTNIQEAVIQENKKNLKQLEANKRYIEKNRDKYNKYFKELEKKKYDENPEFREKKRIQNLERYHKKKELLKQQQNAEILGN